MFPSQSIDFTSDKVDICGLKGELPLGDVWLAIDGDVDATSARVAAGLDVDEHLVPQPVREGVESRQRIACTKHATSKNIHIKVRISFKKCSKWADCTFLIRNRVVIRVIFEPVHFLDLNRK